MRIKTNVVALLGARFLFGIVVATVFGLSLLSLVPLSSVLQAQDPRELNSERNERDRILTIDHFVSHISTVPANAGEQTVRTSLHPRFVTSSDPLSWSSIPLGAHGEQKTYGGHQFRTPDGVGILRLPSRFRLPRSSSAAISICRLPSQMCALSTRILGRTKKCSFTSHVRHTSLSGKTNT